MVHRGPIYSTAGTDDKVAFIQNHGATKGINYKTQDFAKEVATLTNNEYAFSAFSLDDLTDASSTEE